MAKTKFLDYTGLANLVEKIKNTYVTMMAGNEFNFIGKSGWSESSSINFNYRKPNRTNVETPITNYFFYNGQREMTGVNVTAENFNGKINGHTVEKNVPSNAVFTDTNTTYTFTSGTGGTFTVQASNSDSGQTVSVGVPAKASAATSAETAATAATAEKVGSETVGSATKPMYLSGGTPTECSHSLNADVPDGAVFTDEKVKQVINTTDGAIHPILFSAWAEDNKGEMPQENHACINWNFSVIPQNGTLKATNFSATTFSGDTFNGNTFTGKAKTADTAYIASLAGKLSINAGSVSADDVLVIGNYAGGPILMGGRVRPGEFTPSGIVLKITDPDIEDEIKKAIVWPTA